MYNYISNWNQAWLGSIIALWDWAAHFVSFLHTHQLLTPCQKHWMLVSQFFISLPRNGHSNTLLPINALLGSSEFKRVLICPAWSPSCGWQLTWEHKDIKIAASSLCLLSPWEISTNAEVREANQASCSRLAVLRWSLLDSLPLYPQPLSQPAWWL